MSILGSLECGWPPGCRVGGLDTQTHTFMVIVLRSKYSFVNFLAVERDEELIVRASNPKV
jgi:hypothetical protein